MKKIVFISNYLTHHQIPFCDAMNSFEDIDFKFIATKSFSEERKAGGWKYDASHNYCIQYNENLNKTDINRLIYDADAVIVGSAPNSMVKDRISAGKLVFRYNERPLKNGIEIKKYPFRLFKWHKENPANKNIYMLCASAYTATDYSKFGLFKNKAYKWGYFPETRKYRSEDDVILSKDSKKILWCGRFVDFKHAEYAVKVAARLKSSGYDFSMEIIGDGTQREELQQMAKQMGVAKNIEFSGVMQENIVRHHMEKAGIYLFTSDRGEGWGAVLNEAMNSCCAVVASNAAGSTPYLVENGVNGMVYKSGDDEDLYEKVKYLLDNPEEQHRLGKAAYGTMTSLWNAQNAAERFIKLAESIIEGEKHPDLYIDGPCSKAGNTKENWYI